MTDPAPTVDMLLAVRASRIAEIEAIDAELERRGIRALARPAVRTRDVSLAILVALGGGPLGTKGIVAITGQTHHAAAQLLSKMTMAGEIVRAGRGLYRLPRKAKRA